MIQLLFYLLNKSHQILNTILSRCQVVTFRPLPTESLIRRLQDEGITASLSTLAAQLTNSFDEALALCSDEWFAQARALVIKLCEALEKDKTSIFCTRKMGKTLWRERTITARFRYVTPYL